MASLIQWTWIWASTWEIVKNREAWCATVHEGTKSQTQICDLIARHLKRNISKMVTLRFLSKHTFQETSCYTQIYIYICTYTHMYIYTQKYMYIHIYFLFCLKWEVYCDISTGLLLWLMVRNTPEDGKGYCIETVNNLNLLKIYNKTHTLFTYMRPWDWLLTYFKNKSCTSKCLVFCSLYLLFISTK